MNFGGYQDTGGFGGGYGGGGGGYGGGGGGYGGGGGGGFGGGGGGFGGGGGGYGGGGGDGFGGGGFMSSQGMSPSSQMQDEKKKGSRNQSIIPVTSAIIHGANHTGDNEFELDGVQLSLVILVGEIVSVNESQTNVVYKVDDRTGPLVDVKKWLDDQESEAELNQRAECREGIFVKVIGHIRTFSQQRSLVSYLIQPIRDFNAVTHHMVSVVHSQLSLKKGPVVPEQFANLTSVTPAAGPSGSTWGNPQATSTPGFFGGRVDSGMSQIQQTVLNTISQCKMDQGISMSDLIRNVGSKGFNEKNIRTAVDFLCNEGHVYSTIDDEHFKSTDA